MAEKEGGDTVTIESLQAELAQTKDALKAANHEAAERRIKLKDLEGSHSSVLTETEQLKKDLGDIKTLLAQEQTEKQQRKIQDAIVAKAKELGFENPDDAALLIDKSKVEITADGSVKGFEAGLDALSKTNRLPMKGDNPLRSKGTLVLPKQGSSGAGVTAADKVVVPAHLTHM